MAKTNRAISRSLPEMSSLDPIAGHDRSKALMNDLASLIKFSPDAIERRAPFLLLPSHPEKLFRKPSFIPQPPPRSHYMGIPPKHSDHHLLAQPVPSAMPLSPIPAKKPTETKVGEEVKTKGEIEKGHKKPGRSITFDEKSIDIFRRSPTEETTISEVYFFKFLQFQSLTNLSLEA